MTSKLNRAQVMRAGVEWLVDPATEDVLGFRNGRGLRRGLAHLLALFAVPVCLAPSGTVAADGVITLDTALRTTYTGGIWLRLPADAVVDGEAGLYWAVMTSTTQGQVYTAFADPAGEFVPYVPSEGLVPAVGSAAPYAQATGADVPLVTITVPGNAMGPSGAIRYAAHECHKNSATGKELIVSFSGTQVLSAPSTTTDSGYVEQTTWNRGVTDHQVSPATDPADTVYSAVDTTVAVSVVFAAQLATAATDYLVLESVMIEVLPS